jgi:nucleoid-associated protein YgaU
MRCDLRAQLLGLTIGSGYILTARTPHLSKLIAELRSPRQWVAEAGPDAAAGAVAGALLWLVALWVAAGLAAAAVSLLPGPLGRLGFAVARRLTPIAVRRVLATAAGTSILLSPAAALAAPATGGPPAPTATSSVLPPIGWPTDPPPATSPARPAPSASRSGPVVTEQHAAPGSLPTASRVMVHAGDSLWSIVGRRLGPASSAARIQAEWPRWYAANRPLIGADPNLLQPGTSLQAPQPALEDTEK